MVKGAIVIENNLLTVFVGFVLSVNWIVNWNVPAAVAVPLIVPVAGEEVSVKPFGKEPLASDHVYGGSPPLPARLWLYRPLTVPLAKGELVVMVSAGSMVRANGMEAVTWLLSVTWMVKFEVAAVVGWPVIAPVVEFSKRGLGKDPTVTAHV